MLEGDGEQLECESGLDVVEEGVLLRRADRIDGFEGQS